MKLDKFLKLKSAQITAWVKANEEDCLEYDDPDNLEESDCYYVLNQDVKELLLEIYSAADNDTDIFEMINPQDWSSNDINDRLRCADRFIAVAGKYGFTNLDELDEPNDMMEQAFTDEDPQPISGIPGALQYYNLINGTADPHMLTTWLEDEYTPGEMAEEASSYYEDDAVIEMCQLAVDPAVKKSFKKWSSFSWEELPLGDDYFEDLESTETYKKMLNLAKHPNLRKLGSLSNQDEYAEFFNKMYEFIYP